MNNPGTVLLTVADMSVIEAEVEVDETDIPAVRLGQVAKVTVDAIPDKTFTGKVTEIGNSPIQTAGQGGGAVSSQATNFKVVITVDTEIPDVRPGFTCTAEITTATRDKALSVPIQALAVREITRDAKGQIVREQRKPQRSGGTAVATASAQELPPGHTRKEEEGVFVVRDGTRAEFIPVKTGIAGEKYFEILGSEGIKEGEQVITGPFQSVRNLRDGAQVKVQQPEGSARP
jgi:HlyD family secretion protein